MKDAYRTIPKVDVVLGDDALANLSYSQDIIKRAVQKMLAEIREAIATGRMGESPDASAVAKMAARELESAMESPLRQVINAAGVVVHTNLGRAPLAREALDAVILVAESYSNLEFDLDHGRRGSRQDHIRPVIQAFFGTEDALVVNNNAAAVLLILNTLARGKEVIVSRGELVEIGGSFRVPEVMAMSGALMKEVGTTNKTKLDDYRRTFSDNTGLIVKVHRSNFSILGFTEEAEITELLGLAKEFGVPFYIDMGSGVPFDLSCAGIPDEWTIPDCLKCADIVSFSGDKVLGGPQSGIILGKAAYIRKMAGNPMHRAMRIDKMSIASLGATLRLIAQGRHADVPVLRMILEAPEDVRARARKLKALLKDLDASVIPTQAVIGGGSAPTKSFPSFGVLIASPKSTVIHSRLRKGKPAIVARIDEDKLVFDMKAVDPRMIPQLAQRVREAFSGLS